MDRQTDNQQPKFSDARLELAWLGGFIDGEGSLMLGNRPDRIIVTPRKCVRKKFLVPRIAISGTHEVTFHFIEGLLTNLRLPHHIVWRTWKNPRYKKAWDIRVQGMKRCAVWLGKIEPYLITKRGQANLLIEWIISRQESNRLSPYSERELEIADEIRRLNH